MVDIQSCALLEGVVTTQDESGRVHIAAMGPRVDWPTTRLLLRPFQSSTTFRNLSRTRRGILHVTDDALLIARAATGRLPDEIETCPGPAGYPPRLADCVRWYAFETETIDDSQDRSEMLCRVTSEGRQRDFFGFNRANHVIVEAAILCTRLHLLSLDEVMDRFSEFATIVDKTAGDQQRKAFAELQQFLSDRMAEQDTNTMLNS